MLRWGERWDLLVKKNGENFDAKNVSHLSADKVLNPGRKMILLLVKRAREIALKRKLNESLQNIAAVRATIELFQHFQNAYTYQLSAFWKELWSKFYILVINNYNNKIMIFKELFPADYKRCMDCSKCLAAVPPIEYQWVTFLTRTLPQPNSNHMVCCIL